MADPAGQNRLMTFASSEPAQKQLAQKEDAPRAREYNRIRRRLSILDFLLGLVFLAALLTTGWTSTLRDWAYLGAGQRYALAVFFYVGMLALFTKLLGFPLDYYSFRLEHRYGLSNQDLGGWLRDQAKGWILGLVLATVVVELIYWTIRISPGSWWLMAWAAFVVLSVFFAQIAPVLLFPLFYKFEPLDNEDLRHRLLQLSQRAGTRVRGVYEWKLSEKSKKANAALAGLGRTRRIIISDTLLQNYSTDEIEAVMAHELGHHVHRHVPKGIALQMAISFFGFWAAAGLLRYVVFELRWFDGLSDFANLPLLALASTVMSFALMPALNAYSRYNERQADRYCFHAIPTVAPFISSMEKLADQNLAERRPSRLVEWLFHSHPAISRRVEAATEYAHKHQQPGFASSQPS